MSNILSKNCEKYHGVVAEEFLKELVEGNTTEELKNSIHEEVETQSAKLFEKFSLKEADGQIQRIADVFALYAATGCYTIRFKIFTYTEEQVIESIHCIFDRLLKERGKSSFEEQDIVDSLTGFLLQNDSRFKNINLIEDKPINNCLGYKKKRMKKSFIM